MKQCVMLIMLVALQSFADRYVVQVNDAGETIPPNTIATPQQVASLAESAGEAYDSATNLEARAAACSDKITLYSTNYVVTSTVYVQSIGGVPYDPSNQTVIVRSVAVTETNVSVLATVAQLPLVPPALDWRVTLGSGSSWSNVSATVSSTDIPDGVTNAAAAYLFTLPRPAAASSFFRVVDNSTGASGSGLWWIVFGGIRVDGYDGWTGVVTNGPAEHRFVGGILVEPEPLGGF